MKRYRVTAFVTVSVSVVVEARSKKAALEAAADAPMQTLCHMCSSDAAPESPEWRVGGELDGEPGDLSAAEEIEGE